jgi:cold shock CspA family protein
LLTPLPGLPPRKGGPVFFSEVIQLEGTVHLFFHQKGYGFVENEAGRWFFSGRAVLGESVAPGDNVTFSLDDDPVKPGELKAVDIQKVGGTASTADPCRLFIANLPYTVTETELSDYLAECGSVERVELIRSPDTGESKGFGFAQMADSRSALKAIAQLHGRDIEGRRIGVHLAQRPKGLSRTLSTRQMERRA